MGPLPKRKKIDHSEHNEAPNKRQFQKPVTISSEDYFSNLPIDCIYSVFSFLNQVDLDCIAHISQTLNHFVNRSRSRVPRSTLFANVELRQNSLNEFRLNLTSGNDDGIFNYVSASGRPLTMSDHVNRYRQNKNFDECESFDKIRVPPPILRQIVFAAQRFELREIELNKILIDDSLIHYVKEFKSKQLTIVDGELKDLNQYASLIDGLLSSKIKKISLQMSSIFSIIDVDFIKRMSQNVENPSLEVHLDYIYGEFSDDELYDMATVMDRSTHDALPFFKTLRHPLMQANADWVMETLMKRIGKNRNGDWELGCSRMLFLNDFLTGVEPHHEIVYNEGRDVEMFKITTKTRSKIVTLATICTWNTEIRVHFNKH